jgi:aminoglycoside phosphotransferase (APT) family kinase protein
VLVHLAPAPVVARVATTTALVRPQPGEWLARELDVAGFLAERGAPVVAPSDELPAGPHEHAGLFMTFWRFLEHDPVRTPEVTEVAAALAELHAELRAYPRELPVLVPALDEVSRGIAFLEERQALSADDLEFVRDSHARVQCALERSPSPMQPLHGDAHMSNVLHTPDGLVWSDFEDACAGPVDWDLACLTAVSSLVAEPVLGAYGGGSLTRLEPFLEARELQTVVWLALYAQRFPERRGRAEAKVRALRGRS